MENTYWKKTVGTLISAIWLYTLADIAGAITGAVNDLLNPVGIIDMIMSLMGEQEGSSVLSFGDGLESLFSILVFVGYYLFFRSLSRFARMQSDEQDRKSIYSVRMGYILMIVGVIVGFIPIPLLSGLARLILVIVGYVKMLSGYKGLKKSTSFPAEASYGAAKLYSCTIWILVGAILGCLPFCGDMIEGIISLVVFFVILSAWKRIKNAAPELTPQQEAELCRNELPSHVQRLSDILIAFFGITFIGVLFGSAIYFQWIDFEPYVMYHNNNYYTEFQHGLFGFIFNILILLSLLGIIIWALRSRTLELKTYSKVGLVLLLISNVIYLFHDIWIYMEEYNAILGYTDIASDIFHVLGLCLFIIGSKADKALKIVVSIVPLVNCLWYYIAHMLYGGSEVIAEDFDGFSDFLSGGRLLLWFIYFGLVFLFVWKYKQKNSKDQSIFKATTL